MIRSSFQKLDDQQSIDVSLSREIATEYDNVKIVADNMEDVKDVADAVNSPLFDNMEIIVDNLADINSVANTVVPNIAEILLADDNATIATTQAGIATAQAVIGTTKASEASISAGNALTSENNANTSEANTLSYKNSAEASATTATIQAGIATTKASEAGVSASNALASETQAGIYASQLDPTKIVAKDSPTGSAMIPSGITAERTVTPLFGAQRANSTLTVMEWWNGSAWVGLGGDVSASIHSATSKTTPINADEFGIWDSVSALLRKVTFSNLKATLDATWIANDSRAKTALNASGIAPIYACRAWVNFNGMGTVTIRASGNVSSITDNGVGDYTVNFSTAMPDANYSLGAVASGDTSGVPLSIKSATTSDVPVLMTTSQVRVQTKAASGVSYDLSVVSLEVFR